MVKTSPVTKKREPTSQSHGPLRFLLLKKALSVSGGCEETLLREWPDCAIHQVGSVVDYSVALAHREFDVILADDDLVQMDDEGALALARKICPEKPVIILAKSVGEERTVEWMHEGACDLVLKQNLDRLGPAVRGAIQRAVEAKKQQQPEEALREARARIDQQAALLDHAQDAILVQRVDGGITYWNKGAQRLYGWSRDEVMGRDAMDLLGANPASCQFARAHTRANGEWRGELRHQTKAGREVVVQSSWTLVENANARPQAFLVINTDVTENRLLEAKFLRAQRMESMGMMVGGIAHDLNNMLAPILMSVDILQSTLEQSPQKELIGTIHRSAKNGAALVKQLLAFARGAEGKHVDVDLTSLLTEFVEFMGKTLKGDVRLSLSFLQPTQPIKADITQLKQVLMNLCINARDAMPEGGSITITLDRTEIDEAAAKLLPEAFPGSYVVLSVADTGEGMTPQIVERIFDPFYTTKDSNRGTGLGLATVRGIIKGHGGFITVESKPKAGTTFRVYLPVEGTKFNEGPSGTPFASGILLVDDEEMVRTTLSLLLKAEGYRIFAAEGGEEALSILESRGDDIHMMISDLRMSGMDGSELIKATREKNYSMPIIAMTGSPLARDKEHLAKFNARLLPKPMTRAILLEAVKRELDVVPGEA